MRIEECDTIEGMPRFVILLHEMPVNCVRGTHLDLMLEQGGMLRTWAMGQLPATGETMIAERLQDHRLAYLDYEGEISGGRGCVSKVDAGEYEVVEENQEVTRVRMHGQKLRGTLTLTHDEHHDQRWRVDFSSG